MVGRITKGASIRGVLERRESAERRSVRSVRESGFRRLRTVRHIRHAARPVEFSALPRYPEDQRPGIPRIAESSHHRLSDRCPACGDCPRVHGAHGLRGSALLRIQTPRHRPRAHSHRFGAPARRRVDNYRQSGQAPVESDFAIHRTQIRLAARRQRRRAAGVRHGPPGRVRTRQPQTADEVRRAASGRAI